MNEAIYWLNVNLIITALMWVPYILNRVLKQGIGAMGYAGDLPPMSDWAIRAKKAHYNAIENLVVFAPAVLAYLMLDGSNFEAVQCAIGIYMFSRIVHYLSFTFKVPYLRTLSFVVNWGATMYVLFQVCSLAGK
ncbi:MAG: putative MAPEG superfamily protein [Bacteriovoracaceae bacterium]|jgi:uncharacterized MAPEG superfamily protein